MAENSSARHADPPVRRHRLRHAALHPCRRPRGHAGVDEFHQPRARRVRDGRRLHHGAAHEPRRRAVPGLPADRLRRHRAARRAARADALPADVRAAAPRPGAVLDRPGVHGGHRRRLLRRLDAAEHPAARLAAGTTADRGGRRRQVPALHRRRLRVAHGRAAVGAVADALRQPPARLGRRSARRRRPRPRRQPHLPAHLRGRLGPGRARRRARRRGARPRSERFRSSS